MMKINIKQHRVLINNGYNYSDTLKRNTYIKRFGDGALYFNVLLEFNIRSYKINIYIRESNILCKEVFFKNTWPSIKEINYEIKNLLVNIASNIMDSMFNL